MNKKRAIRALAIVFTVAALVGCQSGNQQGNEETASPEAASSSSSSSRRPALRHRSEASSTPAAPTTRTVTVPAGTEIPVRLTTGLNTGSTSSGSAFEGSLAAPLSVNGVEVAATGSRVAGTVTNVVSSGRLNRPAEISLVLTSLTPEGGQAIQISTSTWSASGKSHKKRDIIAIGGGAGLGAAIGAIAGGGKGAAIGSAVGAAGGTAGAYATGKKEISLPPETRLNFRLSAPATFTVH
jgi:hypothetical protein